MTGLLIGFVVIVVLFIGTILYSHFRKKFAKPLPDFPNVKNLTQSNFKQYTTGGFVVVDFWAPWNEASKKMVSILNNIAGEQEERLKVGKVNIDNQQAIAAKFKIRSIPTLIFLKNGKEVKRLSGAKNKKELQNEISEFFG